MTSDTAVAYRPGTLGFAATWAPRMLSVLRIVVAALFMAHGIQKLFSFPAAPSFGVPPAFSLLWFAAVLELVGGLLMLFGFATRPVAFILSGEMAFAYFMSHAPRSLYPVANGGDAAILYCFVFLYFAFAGAGRWSVDDARLTHSA